ncbi:MAG: 50S ribosomal protein L1 [candidate division TM6 bacterium GW2011_GWE2_41_16]|nr:MAG: 50S ribosomal protein L1 [candidate division TM6 bacterium GW2011_GWE2_41_16]
MKHKHGKKYRKIQETLKKEVYSLQEGIVKAKESTYAKFDESVDVNVVLGIDPTKGEHVVRGSVVLPHGVGKISRVLVFAKGEYADAAKAAGADFVGAEDLIEKVLGGWMDFTHAVATPDLMGLVGKVAKILGPRGLLPNKKLGTVTFDVATAVSELKEGKLFFKNDKNGAVNFMFGKASFTPDKLKSNLVTFLKALSAAKPASSKGVFLKKITIATTMGPGIQISGDVE